MLQMAKTKLKKPLLITLIVITGILVLLAAAVDAVLLTLLLS